jgi:hypothetical protein
MQKQQVQTLINKKIIKQREPKSYGENFDDF